MGLTLLDAQVYVKYSETCIKCVCVSLQETILERAARRIMKHSKARMEERRCCLM